LTNQHCIGNIQQFYFSYYLLLSAYFFEINVRDEKQGKNTKNKESVEHHCVQGNTNNKNKT